MDRSFLPASQASIIAAYLHKPFPVDRLIDAITSAIGSVAVTYSNNEETLLRGDV